MKKKMQRFAEMETFPNVIQPAFDDVFGKQYRLKGNWAASEFMNPNPLVLELGCGKGEYTVGLAKRHPEKNLIGIDIKGSRMWRGAKTAVDEGVKNTRFLRTHIEMINSFFAADEVDEIWITFPDPQLKKKRKRLTSPGFLSRYSLFLRNNGLVHLKTDNDVLYKYTYDLAVLNGFTIRFSTTDLYSSDIRGTAVEIQTFYERQFLSQGMKINYLCFELPHGKEILEPEDDKPEG
jgi:tRNA (guanine-N7-)-methyltransferase